jgi:hypothetical protein
MSSQDTIQETGFFKYAEENRFGIISMVLIFIGCLGGFTLSMGGLHSDVILIGLIVTTMATLSLMLAVQPMRYIIYATGAALAVNLISLISLAF